MSSCALVIADSDTVQSGLELAKPFSSHLVGHFRKNFLTYGVQKVQIGKAYLRVFCGLVGETLQDLKSLLSRERRSVFVYSLPIDGSESESDSPDTERVLVWNASPPFIGLEILNQSLIVHFLPFFLLCISFLNQDSFLW